MSKKINKATPIINFFFYFLLFESITKNNRAKFKKPVLIFQIYLDFFFFVVVIQTAGMESAQFRPYLRYKIFSYFYFISKYFSLNFYILIKIYTLRRRFALIDLIKNEI